MAKRVDGKGGGKKGKGGGQVAGLGARRAGTTAPPVAVPPSDAVLMERQRCAGIAAYAWQRISVEEAGTMAVSIADRAFYDIEKGTPWPPAPPAAPPRKRAGRDQRNWT